MKPIVQPTVQHIVQHIVSFGVDSFTVFWQCIVRVLQH